MPHHPILWLAVTGIAVIVVIAAKRISIAIQHRKNMERLKAFDEAQAMAERMRQK